MRNELPPSCKVAAKRKHAVWEPSASSGCSAVGREERICGQHACCGHHCRADCLFQIHCEMASRMMNGQTERAQRWVRESCDALFRCSTSFQRVGVNRVEQ